MKINKISSNKNIIRALAVLLILSMLVVLSGVNKPHLNPFKTSIHCSNIVLKETKDANNGLIVDSNAKRILILNSDEELIRVIDLTKAGSPIEKLTDAIIADGKLYVVGTTLYNSGKYISGEKLIEYDLKGNVKQIISEKQYDKNEYITNNSFKSITYNNKQIYLCETQDKSIILSGFNVNNYKSQIISKYNIADPVFSAIYIPESNTLEIVTIYQKKFIFGISSNKLISNSDYVIGTNIKGDNQTVKYSSIFAISNIIYWICLLYCVVVILVGLYVLLDKKIGNKGKLSIVIVILILVASKYYTNNIYNMIDNQYKERIRTQSVQFSELLSREYEELKINNRATIGTVLKGLCDANGVDLGVYARLYVYRDGKYYYYVDSDGKYLSGAEINTKTYNNLVKLKESGQNIFSYTNKYDSNVYAFEYVKDTEGNVIGVVEVGCSEYTLKKEQKDYTVNLFINLVAIYIAILVSISAIKTLFLDGKSFVKLSKDKDPGKGLVLNSYFQFFFKLMTSMDLVIQVYVAQSLCVGYTGAKQAALVAIPMSAYSAGMWIGTLLCPIIISKLGNRKLSLIGCIGSVAAYSISVISLLSGSIFVYSASKLLAGIFAQGVLFIVGDGIPFMIKDTKERSNAIVSAQQSTTAASILATLAGGYIAQYLSYAIIYLVAAIFAVVLLVVSVLIFGKHSDSLSTVSMQSNSKDNWLVFLKPVMLVYIICFMLPKTLILGYNSYLFPLYSSSAGISAVLLSNLNAFSNTFSYLTNEPLNKHIAKYDSTKSTVAIALIICTSFICFIISPNIWWAIAVMFIFAALNTIVLKGNKVYIADRADEFNLDPATVRSNSIIIDDGISIFKTPLLSAFVSLGYNYACAAVGAVCGLLFSIFGIYNNNRDKKSKGE